MAAAPANPQGRVGLLPGMVGTLVRVGDDTLTLKIDGTDQMLGVTRNSIAKFEVSAGRRSRTKNALIGAGVGVVGAAVLLLAAFGSDALDEPDVFATSTVTVATLTVPMCALIGAVVLPTPERWKEVPVDRVRVGAAPVRGRGVAVSVEVGF